MADLVLYTGPMFSSKTTRLLMEADTRQYRKQKIISFKSKLDDRYSATGEIVTHNFNKMPAYLVDTGEEMLSKISEQINGGEEIDCVIIDELFMIEGGAEACIALFKRGYDVIIASIDLSFKGEPFEEVMSIMPYCTKIEKCTAVCPICGEDARYTTKKETKEKGLTLIQVGGDELYEPRCQEHYIYMRL
tara:strand:- start:722 stop:1291 length:570 start_codon:yes stop_codon:yes gene_type:complete